MLRCFTFTQFCASDDLWVISQSLTFDSQCTFLAKSAFYGPNTESLVELDPLSGYSPSNWPNNSEWYLLSQLLMEIQVPMVSEFDQQKYWYAFLVKVMIHVGVVTYKPCCNVGTE